MRFVYGTRLLIYYINDVYMFGIIKYRFIPTTPAEKKYPRGVTRYSFPTNRTTRYKRDRGSSGRIPCQRGVCLCKSQLVVVRTRRLEDVQFACLKPKNKLREHGTRHFCGELALISIKRPRDLIRRPTHHFLHQNYRHQHTIIRMYICSPYIIT